VSISLDRLSISLSVAFVHCIAIAKTYTRDPARNVNYSVFFYNSLTLNHLLTDFQNSAVDLQ